MGIICVCVCRVSTLEQSYQRQIDEIKEHCEKNGWEIKHFFANKISGATKIEKRSEIMEMMEYIVSIRRSTSFILMLSFLSLRYNLDVKMLLW